MRVLEKRATTEDFAGTFVIETKSAWGARSKELGMTNIEPGGQNAEVERAVKLLELRERDNTLAKKVAVEMKITGCRGRSSAGRKAARLAKAAGSRTRGANASETSLPGGGGSCEHRGLDQGEGREVACQSDARRHHPPLAGDHRSRQ